MPLLLFDIDGTLLTSDGAAGPAILQALSEFAGKPIDRHDVSFSGKTDPVIMREILQANDVAPAAVEAILPHALSAYATLASDVITPGSVHALPGARAVIEMLAPRHGATLALLTGNLEHTAYLKLEAVHMRSYFRFGAFGSDHGDRNELPLIACARATEALNRTVRPQEAVIIGDTPRDIACGKAHGCRTVAVATGSFSEEALAAHAPDAILRDLRDATAVLDALGLR